MSKIYILKEAPKSYVEGYKGYKELIRTKCLVPIDIDELVRSWLDHWVTYNFVWSIYQLECKFSEFLQERMK